MKIAVIHDYANALRGTRAFGKLSGHEVIVHSEAYTDPARVVEQIKGCEAVLLTQQRVKMTRQIIERLPGLKFISQTGRNVYHLDIAACTEHGIVVSAGGGEGGTPYSTTAEIAWGLIIASLRQLPYEVERLKQDTRGIVTAADLARMKPTALLVNTSRAPIIAEGALVAALQKGRPGFAAVDVYEEEPVVGANHPLLKMKNALCTPHLGYDEHGNYERMYAQAVERLLAYAGGKPIEVMNPEAVGRK